MKKDLSRRKFLKKTASALAAANTLFLRDTRLEAASYPAVAPSDRLRFGIIGIGMQGSGLLTAAVQLPGVECVAPAARSLVAGGFRPPIFTTAATRSHAKSSAIPIFLSRAATKISSTTKKSI